MKKVKTIRALLAEQIAQEKSYIAEHDEIRAILEKVDGKPVDGRTFNKKRLGRFSFETVAGSMFHIRGQYSHLIGYSSDPFVSAAKFEELDACHGTAARNRIKQCETLNAKRLQQIQTAIAKAFETLKAQFRALESENLGSYHNPIYYDMLRAIHDDSAQHGYSKIQLSDFYYLRDVE